MYFIADSARRHGIADEDMLHAVRNVIITHHLDDGLTMFIGPAMDASPLEIGVVDGHDGPVIVHAMAARPKFFPRKGAR